MLVGVNLHPQGIIYGMSTMFLFFSTSTIHCYGHFVINFSISIVVGSLLPLSSLDIIISLSFMGVLCNIWVTFQDFSTNRI